MRLSDVYPWDTIRKDNHIHMRLVLFFFYSVLTQYNWNKKPKIFYIFITVINDYNSNKAVIFSSFIMLQEKEILHLFSVTKGKKSTAHEISHLAWSLIKVKKWPIWIITRWHSSNFQRLAVFSVKKHCWASTLWTQAAYRTHWRKI